MKRIQWKNTFKNTCSNTAKSIKTHTENGQQADIRKTPINTPKIAVENKAKYVLASKKSSRPTHYGNKLKKYLQYAVDL